jgi:PAS domain S-box-containing protein
MFNSLKAKFIVSFVFVELIFLILISFVNFSSLEKASNNLIDEKIEVSSQLLIELIKVPMITYDLATIDDALLNFSNIKNVVAVNLKTADGIVLSNHIDEKYLSQMEFEKIINDNNIKHQENDRFVFTTKKIVVDSKELGHINFIFDNSANLSIISQTKFITYMIIIADLLIGFIISYIIGRKLGISIKHLTKISNMVSQDKNIDIPYDKNRKDEIGILFNSMHDMQQLINGRTSKLKNSINDLENFIKALNASAIVSKADIDERITFVNDKFMQMTGYNSSEIIGNTHRIIKDEHTDKKVYDDMWDTIHSKKIFHNIFKNRKKSGEAFYVDTTIVPLLDKDDNIKEYIAISYEVTEILEARNKAIEAKRVKEEFLANMSHEIRTPMNAILGFSEILKGGISGEKEKKYIDHIYNSSSSLLHIINDILDFSKIESGKLEINKYPFSPKTEFNKIVGLFLLSAKQKSIELSINIDSEMPEYLNGDIVRIEQILNNLLSNAIKFTENGKKISVDTFYFREKSILNISVKDEGIGISLDAQDKIFNAFVQADGSTTRKFGGTGLGLAISSKLANFMNGDISVASKEGEGSTFTLRIPIDECDTSKTSDIEPQDNENTKKRYKGNILVAEDNVTNQILIETLLEDYGLSFEIVSDGLKAVEAYRADKYDLILMDENMPNMCGSEAFNKIRDYESANNLNKTPIVALTANALDSDKEKFLEIGMDDFLSKPIDVVKLENILDKFLNITKL